MPPVRGRLAGVRKIAVLRASGVGDLVFALPALEALRHAYEDADIALLGRHWHADFLRGRPGPVDRVVVVPYSRGVYDPAGSREDPAGLPRFFDRMKAERFDLAVQLHGGGRHSNPFVLALGARVTAGARTPDAPPLDRWIPYVYFQHEVLRCLETVSLVGAPPVTIEPRLPVTREDLDSSLRAVPPTARALVFVHAGAGDARRRWPPARFAEVADALLATGAEVVVHGVGGERARAGAIVRRLCGATRVLDGEVPLGVLAALLARCRLVVANDSGPLHLAAAVGTATVGVFWCGNLVTAGPVSCARHRALVSWRLACPRCGRSCLADGCAHRVSFVADVPSAAVAAVAAELLSDAAASPETGPRGLGG